MFGPSIRLLCKPSETSACRLLVQWYTTDKGWVTLGDYDDATELDQAADHARQARRALLEGEIPNGIHI